MKPSDYGRQARGDSSAYASYYEGMDRTMRQKVALITSYLPASGTLADMGCGSGSGSHDLARLFPALGVVGVDINPQSVEWARAHYRAGKLDYRVGDIAEALFERGSLQAILDSSVLHHVSSFNDFSTERLRALLDRQTEQLCEGGMLAIRDFVVPEGPSAVLIDLPIAGTAGEGDPIEDLSIAALFVRFARTFKCQAYPRGEIPVEEARCDRPGFRRFRAPLRLATEFVLRKDYRHDWAVELLEEYLFFTQREYEEELTRRGLRILLSRPIWNPWIVSHRFAGQFFLSDEQGQALPFPPTNYIILAEKAPTRGVSMAALDQPATMPPSYLQLRHQRDASSGQIFDLVGRPSPTLDVIPYFWRGDELFVLFRQGYPRPLLHVAELDPPVDRVRTSGYLNEPIAAVLDSSSDLEASTRGVLQERAGIEETEIRGVEPGQVYFPSAGGVDEKVQACLVELAGGRPAIQGTYRSGFASVGRIQALQAEQLLRSCQAGGMLDARLELNTYDLLDKQGLGWGPWIGAELPAPGATPATAPRPEPLAALLAAPPRKRFQHSSEPGGFLRILRRSFVEKNRADQPLASQELEYVVPTHWSTNTIVALPYCQHGPDLLVGIEERDLPTPQIHGNSSRILTAPAFRLPKEIGNLDSAEAFARDQLGLHFGLRLARSFPLGCSYVPTAGLTPEHVLPLAFELAAIETPRPDLHWIPLAELLAARRQLRDGHLLIAIFRLAHAARQAWSER